MTNAANDGIPFGPETEKLPCQSLKTSRLSGALRKQAIITLVSQTSKSSLATLISLRISYQTASEPRATAF